MVREKTSVIWKIKKEDLEKIVKNQSSLSGILRYLGLSLAGNIKTLKNKLEYDSIDYQHIKLGLSSNKGRKFNNHKSISDYLTEGALTSHKTSSKLLKRLLFKHNMLENKCSKCGQLPEWNGESLTLQLDHINGNNYDNRLENLRILCPNCHTQTPTFAGRKLKKHNNCEKCHIAIKSTSTLCKKCKPSMRKSKIEWPPNCELITLTNEFGFCEIGRRLGVSDNAIRKHIIKTSNLVGAAEFESA